MGATPALLGCPTLHRRVRLLPRQVSLVPVYPSLWQPKETQKQLLSRVPWEAWRKGISLPHISPTGPWKRRMQRRNCKSAACCTSPFSVSPGTGWSIHGSIPSPCPSARSSRMQMLVRPSLPMLGGSLDKTSWGLCPLGHQSVAQEWIGDVS